MKIALVIFTAYGAGNQYAALLANSIAVKGHTVSAFVPSDADESHYDRKVTLIKLPLSGSLLRTLITCLDPSFLISWNKMITAQEPDVVHIVFEQRFPYFFISALKHRFPVVTTVHEPNPIPNRGAIANQVAAALEFINNRQLGRLSDRIIIQGEKLRNARIFKSVVPGKIAVIPLGSFSFLKHDLPGITTVRNNLLFFGRIAAYKGLRYLIQAAKQSKSVIPNLTVTIAGEGDFSRYRELVKEDDTFTILNYYIPDNKAAELFQKAAIVVLPYTDGSQTGIISIAGEFRKPVIASNVGNFSDMVIDGTTGMLIPASDTDALEKAIIRLLKDDDLRLSMGEAAYKIMGEKFSWEIISAQIVEAYKTSIRDYERQRNKVR